MFFDNPIIGVGVRNFRHSCKDKNKIDCSTHPHSKFLEFISELGVVGFIIFVSFFIFISKNLIFNQKKDYKSLFSVIILLQIFPLIPAGSFFNNYNSTIFFLIFSFFIHHYHKDISEFKK